MRTTPDQPAHPQPAAAPATAVAVARAATAARAALRALRALLPALAFYLLTVALLAGTLGLGLAITGGSHSPSLHRHGALVPAEVWGISAVVACVLLYGLYAMRGPGRSRPEGVRVSRQQQPQLWQLVERTARATGVRAPHTLWLTDDSDLTASQGSRLLGLLPGRRRLAVGVPLLVGLTEPQLAALLAQRLGPARSADTPLPGLLRRNRAALLLVLDRYADTPAPAPAPARTAADPLPGPLDGPLSGLVLSPRRWFGGMYLGYARACLRWSAPDARRLALAADDAAARTAGPGTTAAALRRAPALAALHRRYREQQVLTGWDQGAFPPAAEVLPAYQDWLRSPAGEQELARLEGSPPRERIPRHDPRPTLPERLARLARLRQLPPAEAATEPPTPASLLLADPLRTCTQVVQAAPGVAAKRQLPWDDLAALAGRAELDAAAAGLLTSVASVLRHRTRDPGPALPTVLDAIDGGRWAELADWIPRTGAARTVPVAVGRSLNLSTAAQGLHALVLAALVEQGRARWTLDPQHGRRLTLAPDVRDDVLGPALDSATDSPPDTAPLRRLLGPEPESLPPVER
jgi:hypothetical protein